MSYEVLEKQLKSLPEEYLEDVLNYVQLLQYKITVLGEKKEEKPNVARRFGIAKGELHYPDDIDFCNDEIAEMFGVNE